MNENAKKIGLVVVIVIAIVAAGFGAKRLFTGDQPQFTGSTVVPPGARSMKDIEMEAQNKGKTGQPAEDKSLNLAGG
jgi:hypothetical protein